jgi:hypothetical protein
VGVDGGGCPTGARKTLVERVRMQLFFEQILNNETPKFTHPEVHSGLLPSINQEKADLANHSDGGTLSNAWHLSSTAIIYRLQSHD